MWKYIRHQQLIREALHLKFTVIIFFFFSFSSFRTFSIYRALMTGVCTQETHLTCRVWREGWPLQSSGISQGCPPEQAEAPLRDWQVGDLRKKHRDTETTIYRTGSLLKHPVVSCKPETNTMLLTFSVAEWSSQRKRENISQKFCIGDKIGAL